MVNMMTLTLKTEKYIKDKYDEAALDHLRQKQNKTKKTKKQKKSPPNSPRYQKHHQTILNIFNEVTHR